MATIIDLLMALNQGNLPPIPQPAQPVPLAPAPTGNVPEYGGPSQVTEPPQAPLDTRIIQQMLALRGPAPTPPAPLSRGQRIANALMGFGAGIQGNGPQFLEQLAQPQREYQRQLQQYNNLGTELGARGLETAQRQQERQTTRAQQVSDREFAAEVRRETRRLNLSDDREKALLADALLSRRQREDDERQAKLEQQKQRAQQERDARQYAAKLGSGPAAARPEIAEELGNYYAKLTDKLSPAAARYLNAQAQKAQILATRAATGGGGGTNAKAQKALGQFEAIKQKLIEAVKTGNSQAQKQLMTDLNRSFRGLARFPEIEAGFDPSGKWPYAKFRTPQGSVAAPGVAPQGQSNDPLGIR